MSHLDPDQLALLAMGEPVASAPERAHLASCPVCAAEVAEMSHAVTVARSTMDDMELEAPPSRVWDAIADELGLDAALGADPLVTGSEDRPLTAAAPQPEATDEGGSRRELRPRRRSRAIWVLAASVALIVAVGTGLWAGLVSLSPTSIASATLDAFPDHPDAVGSAEVDEARDGTRTLTVSLEGAAESDDYREVWLIRNDGQALISLGVLEDETGRFPIPPGVDLAEYDLVDISFEPVDGDPAHSGDSIVRGQLSRA